MSNNSLKLTTDDKRSLHYAKPTGGEDQMMTQSLLQKIGN